MYGKHWAFEKAEATTTDNYERNRREKKSTQFSSGIGNAIAKTPNIKIPMPANTQEVTMLEQAKTFIRNKG